MKDWFENLEQRDQRALMGAGVALFVIFFYLAIWQPLTGRNAELNERINRDTVDLDWMRSAALEARMLQSADSKPKKDSRTLIARVTAELGQDKLEAARMRPEGENRLRVTLEKIPFSKLLPPLTRLRTNYGVLAQEAAVEPESSSGIVTVHLLLQRADQ